MGHRLISPTMSGRDHLGDIFSQFLEGRFQRAPPLRHLLQITDNRRSDDHAIRNVAQRLYVFGATDAETDGEGNLGLCFQGAQLFD